MKWVQYTAYGTDYGRAQPVRTYGTGTGTRYQVWRVNTSPDYTGKPEPMRSGSVVSPSGEVDRSIVAGAPQVWKAGRYWYRSSIRSGRIGLLGRGVYSRRQGRYEYWYRSSIRSVGSVYLGEVFTRQYRYQIPGTKAVERRRSYCALIKGCATNCAIWTEGGSCRFSCCSSLLSRHGRHPQLCTSP